MKILRMMAVSLIVLSEMTQAAFVTIGDADNPSDPSTGCGAVAYEYRISDHEVTIAEFQASGAGNDNEDYWNEGIRTVGGNAPASNVSWYEATKYCNWLTSGDVYSGAYLYDDSGIFLGVDRDMAVATYGTVYVLPTDDEWYKAAFYTGNENSLWSLYANGTDIVPIHGTSDGWNYENDDGYANGSPNYVWVVGFGGKEQNSTYDMMGNVWEWTESAYDGILDNLSEVRAIRGGSYETGEGSLDAESPGAGNPLFESYGTLGFRVVMIPEPSTILLFGLGGIGAWLLRRSRKKTDECDE
jgi:formylglycine-generating enzyme required for sulfatase activity